MTAAAAGGQARVHRRRAVIDHDHGRAHAAAGARIPALDGALERVKDEHGGNAATGTWDREVRGRIEDLAGRAGR